MPVPSEGVTNAASVLEGAGVVVLAGKSLLSVIVDAVDDVSDSSESEATQIPKVLFSS